MASFVRMLLSLTSDLKLAFERHGVEDLFGFFEHFKSLTTFASRVSVRKYSGLNLSQRISCTLG